jgi:hypothetical protein
MTSELTGLRQALVTDLVRRATIAYQTRDWALALSLYRHIAETYPAIGTELSCHLIVARCEIELADDAALAAYESHLAQTGASSHEAALVHDIKLRAIECCRAAEYRRASRLLRLLSDFDGPIGRCYADAMLTRRSGCADHLRAPADAAPPRFLADQGVADWPVATVRERYPGTRLLFVRRYAYQNNPARQNESQDRLTRSAVERGFVVHETNAAAQPGAFTDGYVAALRQTIDNFAPHVILYDELFLSGVSAAPGHADAIASLLEDVRRRRGVRVVKLYTDAWYVASYMPDDLFKHLGRAYDLVQHCHPAILDRGTDAERATVFCYPAPHFLPAQTVEAGTVPRAGFVGSATLINIGRLVWWAESACAGLPLDFIEAKVDAAEQITDLQYANLLRAYQLSINFTQRPTGARILTGRALETPLAGGVLIEEDGPDTRYFMSPGVHYVPYETLPDLCEIVPALLADADRRRQLAAAGQAWITRYFTGDYFWAGLMHRLFG